jgi:hypothetical protein
MPRSLRSRRRIVVCAPRPEARGEAPGHRRSRRASLSSSRECSSRTPRIRVRRRTPPDSPGSSCHSAGWASVLIPRMCLDGPAAYERPGRGRS